MIIQDETATNTTNQSSNVSARVGKKTAAKSSNWTWIRKPKKLYNEKLVIYQAY